MYERASPLLHLRFCNTACIYYAFHKALQVSFSPCMLSEKEKKKNHPRWNETSMFTFHLPRSVQWRNKSLDFSSSLSTWTLKKLMRFHTSRICFTAEIQDAGDRMHHALYRSRRVPLCCLLGEFDWRFKGLTGLKEGQIFDSHNERGQHSY